MNHIEHLTRYTANFIDELVNSGVEHVVISPGSRSTPLALLCTEHPKLREWVIVDERSAAYFALGIAKKTKQAVALVCTSGTAAANYLPAIVEAYYGRIPLLVLTADRPHELRHVGASQTINQLNMYGNFVKHFEEMGLPDSSEKSLRYVRNRASNAVHQASQGNPGPIQLNFPFREPLVPDLTLENLWGERNGLPYNWTMEGKKCLASWQVEDITEKLRNNPKGVIVVGPQVDEALAESIVHLSEKLHIPILADPTSQLRAGKHKKAHIIANYDAIFRVESVRKALQPDYIIRFGAMPISKHYLFYVQTHEAAMQFVVENDGEMREPTNHDSSHLFVEGTLLCEQVLARLDTYEADRAWLQGWQRKEKIAREIVQASANKQLTEGEVITQVMQAIPTQSDLFIANSMPVRDLDTFFMPTDKTITVHANRGVSGIDGITSSMLGIAAVAHVKPTLVIGDLSFYHDLNGLLTAKQYKLDATIVLINNDGGGIFSFLPQAREAKHFEALFGTPHGLDFSKAIELYGGTYECIDEIAALQKALEQAYKHKGLNVIEIQTNRQENVTAHRELWDAIGREMME